MAHEMLVKMKMPIQMADASVEMSKLMSDALMVILLLMTMSYLMLLSKLTRCIMMTDDPQSYLTLCSLMMLHDGSSMMTCWSPDDNACLLMPLTK